MRWVFYTSGTTAHPKGTLHTDRTVGAAALGLNRRFEMTEDDRNALVFPVTHIGGISWLMGGLMAGYRQIMVEAFDPETSCAVLRRNGVTIAGSGPAFWMAYVAEQRRDPTVTAFPNLRVLVGGGAAKPPTLNDEVLEVLGVPLVTGYGSSECPGVAHCGVWDTEATRKSDGYPLDDSAVRIAGPDGELLPVGEVGEIECTGPMLFKGYLDPAENEEVFTDDGWFRTGDLGMLDEHGLLRVTGRVKDIIIRKGENEGSRRRVICIPRRRRRRGPASWNGALRARAHRRTRSRSLDDVIGHCTEHHLAAPEDPRAGGDRRSAPSQFDRQGPQEGARRPLSPAAVRLRSDDDGGGVGQDALGLQLDELPEREQPGAHDVGAHERLDELVRYAPGRTGSTVTRSASPGAEPVLQTLDDHLEILEARITQPEVRDAVRRLTRPCGRTPRALHGAPRRRGASPPAPVRAPTAARGSPRDRRRLQPVLARRLRVHVQDRRAHTRVGLRVDDRAAQELEELLGEFALAAAIQDLDVVQQPPRIGREQRWGRGHRHLPTSVPPASFGRTFVGP